MNSQFLLTNLQCVQPSHLIVCMYVCPGLKQSQEYKVFLLMRRNMLRNERLSSKMNYRAILVTYDTFCTPGPDIRWVSAVQILLWNHLKKTEVVFVRYNLITKLYTNNTLNTTYCTSKNMHTGTNAHMQTA